jgi:hypothetical protein
MPKEVEKKPGDAKDAVLSRGDQIVISISSPLYYAALVVFCVVLFDASYKGVSGIPFLPWNIPYWPVATTLAAIASVLWFLMNRKAIVAQLRRGLERVKNGE